MPHCKRCGIPTEGRGLYCSPMCQLLSHCTTPVDGCWEWTSFIDPKGYGSIKVNNRTMRAHRFSFAVFFGPVPLGHIVRHKCHNRRCVKPAHLVAGSPLDNVYDAIRRGTHNAGHPPGEQHPTAKLTDGDVLAIRADQRSALEIAPIFGVHVTTIRRIRNREKWRHL